MYFYMEFLQILHHVMASEVQYVNCQELHNPTFTPRITPAQSDVSPNCESQQLEVTRAPDIEPVPTLVNLVPLREALEDHVSNLKISQEGQSDASSGGQSQQACPTNGVHVKHASSLVISPPAREELPDHIPYVDATTKIQAVAIRPVLQATSIQTTKMLQDTVSIPEISLEEQMIASQDGGQYQDSVSVVQAERRTAAQGPDSIPRPDEPFISDQDDVQFILSVTRKKRKKRLRLDHLPGDQSQTSSARLGKDSPGNINSHAGQSTCLDPQTAGLKFTTAQNLPHPHPRMQHAHENSSFPPAAPSSLLRTGPSPAASIPKTRKATTRKRKRDQDNNLLATPRMLSSTNANNMLVSMETPVLHQHQQSPQGFFPTRPLSNMQHMSGMNLAGIGQSTSGFGAHSLPLGFGPESQQTRASDAQSLIYSQDRPAATTNQKLSMSASMSESLRRRPSLYSVTQWQSSSPSTGMTMRAMAASAARSVYQSPYDSKNGTLPGVPQTLLHIAGSENLPLSGSRLQDSLPSCPICLQPLSVQQPTAPQTGVQNPQPAHPTNMLVDIAQTCQENFPFALIAKRHNQPIQKVFDTFSAVIQLPLLRSTVDARRPGKLGSLRMKEFRAIKKTAKQLQKERQVVTKGAKKEGNGTVGA